MGHPGPPPPPPPPEEQKNNYSVAHISKTGGYFHSPGFDLKAHLDPPNMKIWGFFHILGLNSTISYQITSLFDIYG